MSDDDFSCAVCLRRYQAPSSFSSPNVAVVDLRPKILCKNGHSFCSECCSSLVSSCPLCRENVLEDPIVNVQLMQAVERSREAMAKVPEIPAGEVVFENKDPVASGAYADVFLCRWNQHQIAVKRLRLSTTSPSDQEHLRSLHVETSLAIGLHHPNIVRVFGTIRMKENLTGIAMEWADQGSLRQKMTTMTISQKVATALGICNGLAYLHGQKIAHRDLKPDNVLLFGPSMTAKIADFGTSKVIQTMITNTSMAGTPKYTAPELLDTGKQYGASVDVFSISILMYELFSGLDPFPGCESVFQVLTALIRNQRPTIPSSFPPEIRDLVQQGWDSDPNQRPSISQIRSALSTMEGGTTLPRRPLGPAGDRATTVSAPVQVAEVSRTTVVSPLIAAQWGQGCERDNSTGLRKVMVENVRTKCNFKSMITPSILKAMEFVPRHLFTLAPAEQAYQYNKAMKATDFSNESSPEIIGVQLSLVRIVQGCKVLLVGGKGGYINSLVAQIVGVGSLGGKVVTVSGNKGVLDVCKKRVEDANSNLARVMEWVHVNGDVADESVLLASSLTTGERSKFDAVIYCGFVPALPMSLAIRLVNPGGSLLAPVQIKEDQQQFQLVLVDPDDGSMEIRMITEFGVIFEKAK